MNQPHLLKTQRAASALAALALIGGSACLATNAAASSHREAPSITKSPKVDGTDMYAFRSYAPGREGYVTFLADYQPFQEPFGGPNYYFMDPDALYEIHVDNDGDCKEDLTFQFRFKNNFKDIALDVDGKKNAIPLLYAGQIKPGDESALNLKETYSLNVVRGDRRTGKSAAVVNVSNGSREFVKPFDYAGKKTLPNYEEYADQFEYNVRIPGCDGTGRVFVGQKRDPFVINVGETFDLVNVDPTGARNSRKNDIQDNVTTFALEVPIACVSKGKNPVIGVWQTASLPQNCKRDPNPHSECAVRESGAFTQVSRLGMPLVNEIVIGLPDKDKFNASKPENDAQFLKYVTNPTFPELVEKLFPGVKAPEAPRTDLVGVFLTGVKGVNATPGACEMERLNTAIPPTPRGSQSDLGAAGCFDPGPVLNLKKAGCDPAGFPNGRRPGDDVVDIELRVAMGALLPASKAPNGQVPFTDGAQVNAGMYPDAWPYVNQPTPGSPQSQRLSEEQTNQPPVQQP